jgi:predicted DCC family thiol-disulfide oxidoreductase YuxK
MSLDRDIIFFDGVCNLCDSFINFTVSRDLKKSFYVASLQGKAAEDYLNKEQRESLKSVVILLKNGTVFKKSRAVLYIFSQLGGIYSVFSIFKILPAFLTDFLYDVVARSRYRIFGKKQTCRIPTVEERSFFMD